MNLIYKLKSLLNYKKSKVMVGKKVKLKQGKVSNKPSSSNAHLGETREFIISCKNNSYVDAWYITNEKGLDLGWVYEWEMEIIHETKEELIKEINSLQSKIDTISAKVKWMEETGVEEFDEDEFKVWETLSTLEDSKLSKIEKAKIIAKLVKGK